jgi:hypothetical protein
MFSFSGGFSIFGPKTPAQRTPDELKEMVSRGARNAAGARPRRGPDRPCPAPCLPSIPARRCPSGGALSARTGMESTRRLHVSSFASPLLREFADRTRGGAMRKPRRGRPHVVRAWVVWCADAAPALHGRRRCAHTASPARAFVCEGAAAAEPAEGGWGRASTGNPPRPATAMKGPAATARRLRRVECRVEAVVRGGFVALPSECPRLMLSGEAGS